MNNTLVDSITARALVENFSNREKTRREQAEINYNYYYDRGIEYVDRINDDVSPTTINLVKNVIKKRCSLLYSNKLVRHISGPSESVRFITDLYDHINIDKFLAATDLASELSGTGLVHITSDDSEFGINLQLYNAKDVTVLSNIDDPNKSDAISIIRTVDTYNTNTKSVETKIRQQIWTDNSVVVYENESGKPPELSSSTEHDLGVIPFVLFAGEEVDGQPLGHPTATGVRQLNANLNELLTNLSYTIKMEAFNILALEGFESGTPISIHPGKALNLPMGSKAYAINFQPKIKEVLDSIRYIEDKIYDISSVPKVSIIGGDASSGRELMIKWFPLVAVFREKQVRWTNYEFNLMNTILKLVKLPEIEYLKIDYPEDKVLPISTEQDQIVKDIELNITTAIDEIVRRDPDLTAEEAMNIYLSNLEINSISISNNRDSKDNKDHTGTEESDDIKLEAKNNKSQED